VPALTEKIVIQGNALPRIFDNIEKSLLPTLQQTLQAAERAAERADFCVGYFNLRGWRAVADQVDRWAGGAGQCCRLLVGMHVTPSAELRRALGSGRTQDGAEIEERLDNQSASREKRRMAEEFRQQLMFGAPSKTAGALIYRRNWPPSSTKAGLANACCRLITFISKWPITWRRKRGPAWPRIAFRRFLAIPCSISRSRQSKSPRTISTSAAAC
jgi:hypothetical protein